jgi:hypothetical protein
VSEDHTLKIWNLESGKIIFNLGANVPLICCAVGPGNRDILVGDSVGAVHFLKVVKFD